MRTTTGAPARGDEVGAASPSRRETDAAVDAFVASAWSRLYRTAFLLTGDAHEAEDVVQTALAVVVERWSTIRRTDDPIVYARRVLATTAYRRTRRRRDELQRLLRVRTAERHDAPVDRTGDVTDGIARRDALVVALQQLPARMRATVVLRFYADLGERETAEVLGCSVGTVKSQTSKGLERLRRHLDGEVPR
jgi:RNA polymerase sigma-70 factor (sigma-E family)